VPQLKDSLELSNSLVSLSAVIYMTITILLRPFIKLVEADQIQNYLDADLVRKECMQSVSRLNRSPFPQL